MDVEDAVTAGLDVFDHNPADLAGSSQRRRLWIVGRPPRVLGEREDEVATIRTEHRAFQETRLFAEVSLAVKLTDVVVRQRKELEAGLMLIVPDAAHQRSGRGGDQFHHPTPWQL